MTFAPTCLLSSASRRIGIAAAAVAVGCLLSAGIIHPAGADERSGPNAVGASQNAQPDAVRIPGVKQRIEPPAEAPGGGIYVSVESAEVYGNPQDPPSLYCSVDISIYNFLPVTVADLVVAIDFTAPNGTSGSTLTVFHTLEPGTGDIDRFNQLPLRDCTGIAGKTRPVLCRTIHNDDCTGRVGGMRSGAVSLE